MNSFVSAGLLVPGQAGVSLLIALVIYDIGKSWRAATMFALYLPTFASGIIISTVWRWIFHPEAGLMNWLLGTQIVWMGDRWLAIAGVCLILTTCNLGTYTLVYMGALLQIDHAVLDAARIDGAGRVQMRLRILLPMILPTVRLVTLLVMIAAFQVWETIYMMSPVVEATNLMYDMFHTAFRASRYGLGAAKAMVLVAIVALLTAIKRQVER